MAGPDPQGLFDPDQFVEDITATMLMGIPNDPALKPTFYFADTRTQTRTDAAGKPWRYGTSDPPGDPPPDPIQVPCSVEAREGETDETSIGTFDADEYILGFLGVHWAQIEDFVFVMLGGRKFKRGKKLYTYGLHDVDFHQIRVEADDV